MSAVAVKPRVLWQGATSWFDVAHSSTLGDARTYIGPVPSRVLSPTMTAAVGAHVRAAVEQASTKTGQVIAHNPAICSRCARTLMRSALGSPEDSAKIITGGNPGDDKRYALAWQALGKDVQAVQAALVKIRREAAAGTLRVEAVAGFVTEPDADESPLSRVVGSPWAHLYEQGGWPLKAGQWEDYKLCACGDPNDAQSTPTMIVSGTPAVAALPSRVHLSTRSR